jgi:hypothetical protein
VGDSTGDSLTPLLRSQILSVQTKNRVNLQFVSGATNVQGLVTAVKDVDSKLGAWAQLAVAFNWLWPWKTLVIQGQILPAGLNGAGITLSIGTGARVPTAITFWRRPDSPTPPTTRQPPPGPIAQPLVTPPQDFYDLVPAAATWLVYESARLSRSDSGYFSSAGAVGSGYLAASYGLTPTDKSGALRFLKSALSVDPNNPSARLTLLQRTPGEANAKCDGYFDILKSTNSTKAKGSEWLNSNHLPDLAIGIWGVPHA